MQNIIEICKEFGLEVPADKQGDFTKKVTENYLTKAEHEKKLGKVETDRDTWKEKAETAETALKNFEGIDPANIQKEIDDWKQKAEDAEKNAQKKIDERDYEDALRAEMEGYAFTSEAAKRDVLAQVKEAGLKVRDGKLLGLSDLMEQIRKNDETAFVDEQTQQLEGNKARFTDTQKQNNGSKFGTMTKKDIMDIKDPKERQDAIAKNLSLFGK